jgi:hypothetical protein
MAYQPSLSTKIKRTVEYHRLRLKFFGERLLGHEYVPLRNRITIEPSGHCNLACKFCGYRKKERGRVTMENEDFANYINQAAAMGYRNYSLTSSSGEIFFDKDAAWKLDYLDDHPQVGGYQFYSNLVLPDEAMIDRIFSLQKLEWLGFSIYGHDLESFSRITGKPKQQYRKLVTNLNRIADKGGPGRELFEIHLRTDRAFTWHPDDGVDASSSNLVKAMCRAVREGGVKWIGNWDIYDTWGGMVTPEDVADLDVELSDGSHQPKVGACILLFDEPMIFADGCVNACACRGIDRSLQIGDLKQSSLSQILSSDNKLYRNIIERHNKSDYPDTCKDCMVYRSVYRKPRGWPYTSVAEFFKKISARGEAKV